MIENLDFAAAERPTGIRATFKRQLQRERHAGIILDDFQLRAGFIADVIDIAELFDRRMSNQTSFEQQIKINAELPPRQNAAGQYPLAVVHAILDHIDRAFRHLRTDQHVKILEQRPLVFTQLLIILEQIERQIIVSSGGDRRQIDVTPKRFHVVVTQRGKCRAHRICRRFGINEDIPHQTAEHRCKKKEGE